MGEKGEWVSSYNVLSFESCHYLVQFTAQEGLLPY